MIAIRAVSPWALRALLASCLVAAALPAAAEDLVAVTRSRFPDHAWSPLTAADAALAGAGRAVDPASGWSANPALLRPAAGPRLRVTGMALDPRRSDVKASTRSYSDESPLLTFGEAGFVSSARGAVSWGLYLAHAGYDRAHESFLDTANATQQAPVQRDNEFVSSLDRAGVALATSFGRISVGAAFEAVRVLERFSTSPSEESQNTPPFPQPAELRYQGVALGGVVGAHVAALEWLSVGAAARVAGATDLELEGGRKLGRDEVPPSAEVGVHLGRGAGGNLLLSASWRGEREVALGDTLGRGVERDPARARLAGGYAYVSPVLPWEFRIGLGWSPYAGDGAARTTSFGVGLGYHIEGTIARLSFAREARRTPAGATSTRGFVALGLDLRF